MIGIAVISHGGLCEGLFDSVGMIAGTPEQAEVLSLKLGMSPDDYRQKLSEIIERLDTGAGVLVMVDILGGTPFNSAAFLTQETDKVEVVTGVNLPMLISASLERTDDMTLIELAEKVRAAGADSIKILQQQSAEEVDDDEEV